MDKRIRQTIEDVLNFLLHQRPSVQLVLILWLVSSLWTYSSPDTLPPMIVLLVAVGRHQEIVKIYAEKPDPVKLEEQYYRRVANRILSSFRDDEKVQSSVISFGEYSI